MRLESALFSCGRPREQSMHAALMSPGLFADGSSQQSWTELHMVVDLLVARAGLDKKLTGRVIRPEALMPCFGVAVNALPTSTI